MNHTFSLEKKNDRYKLRIHCHNPLPNPDEWDTYILNADELQSLRDILGVREPTDRIEQDINILNGRLRTAEAKIVSLEGKAVQRYEDIKFLNTHSVRMEDEIGLIKKNYDLMEFINRVMKDRETYEQNRQDEVDKQRGRSRPQT